LVSDSLEEEQPKSVPVFDWDVVVIGAGAAGLMAAARAAARGRRTLLLEKNRNAGVKILMSGGTRCNLTQATNSAGIVKAFGKPGKFLHSAVAAYSPSDLIAEFESWGVLTKVEQTPHTNKVFPASDKAADVLAALLNECRTCGVELLTNEAVENLTRVNDVFCVHTGKQLLTAESVIVTTGGKSYPGSGTCGDGYPWLASLGHTITELRPALTPITTLADWTPALKGIALPVKLEVIDPNVKKPLSIRNEAMLFTHFGISGPAALDVSGAISGHSEPRTLTIRCDLLPEHSREAVDDTLRSAAQANGKKLVSGILCEWFPRRLAEALLPVAEMPSDRRCGELTKKERNRLVNVLKSLALPVSGVRGYKKAEVTAGGVALSEVNSSTMESKLIPKLYLAGEILDLDGPIGGYNFQAAFSTGHLAGLNA